MATGRPLPQLRDGTEVAAWMFKANPEVWDVLAFLESGVDVDSWRMAPSYRVDLIEPGHPALSVRRQCALLGLSRSSLYYEPAAETEENLRLMGLIDREYTAHPFLGSRKLTRWLIEQGERVNRKRVQRLMRLMGLEAIYPKPKVSAADRQHRCIPICC